MKPLKNSTYDSRTADKFVVRLPEGMREEIAERARINGRSMNSEMIMMMREQLAPGAQQPEPLADAARSLIDMVQAELGERTAEQREQEYKFAVEEFMTGRGLPSNAMELVIRGRTGVGKSTVLNNLMHGLQSLLNSAPKIGLGGVPMVYLIQGDTSFRALLEVADGHERVVFVRDFEQESR